jgi:hypothetical protein
LRLNTIDDLGTKWYRCNKCGQQQAVPGTSEEKLRLKQSRDRYRHDLDDKPKIKNRCGDCAAFQTTFCTWNVDDVSLLPTDVACGLFCARPRVETESEKKFLKKVEQLE